MLLFVSVQCIRLSDNFAFRGYMYLTYEATFFCIDHATTLLAIELTVRPVF